MSIKNSKKFSVASFFAGGGLFDLGFQEDFQIIWANEINEWASKSYQKNIGDHIVVGDINTLPIKAIPYADVYIGGPPCTAYSTDGSNRGEFGESGRLVWSYQRIIAVKQPLAFIMENVIGMKQRHGDTLNGLIETYSKLGYNVALESLNAADFSVAQNRKRIFLVGIRRDLGFTFQFPAPSYMRMTVQDAIGNLPAPFSLGTDFQIGIANHVATWTSPSPSRIKELTISPNPRQWHGLRRLQWDKPSHTLVAHIAKDGREFLHPSQDRRLTCRECLRLMGVEDSYIIPESIPLSHQYRLIGNGVSPVVARELAKALNQQLSQQRLLQIS